MQCRILLTVGGTGGHIFPALALAEDLAEKHACAVLFAGGKLSNNPYFAKEHYAFKEVACGQLKKNPLQFAKETCSLIKGVYESVRIIQDFNPDLVIGFGSYFTLPVLIAAKLLHKPIFLHEANSIPGKVNRLFAPFANQTWVHFPAALNQMKGHLAVGGIPLRAKYRKGLVSQEEARKTFQLHPERFTLLVFGGSQGAKRINQLVSTAVLFHLKELIPPFQIIHLTGNHMEAEQLMERYVTAEIAAFVRPFEQRMDLAWAAADIAVTRAGAVSLAEQMEFEVPGVWIPYPFATDHHQETNADFMVNMGFGIRVDEEGLTPQTLAEKIQELCIHLHDRIQKFKHYKKEHCNPPLVEQMMKLINGNRSC